MGTRIKDHVPPSLEKLQEDLRLLRDEVRLKVHLGEMEARDRWIELRPKLEHVERELSGNLASLSEDLRGVAESLRAEIRDLWSELAD